MNVAFSMDATFNCLRRELSNPEKMMNSEKVANHYGNSDLLLRVEAALALAGLKNGVLSKEDLAPLDQFHARGLAATVELAKAAGISRREFVLDIGSGLGGSARYLAKAYDCIVQGVDLSPQFNDIASYLSGRSGLADKVAFQCANALSLPFESQSFDVAWTQHVAMNISDREGLYAEAFRVLRPGGRLAIYDVLDTGTGDLHFPVPWSKTPETSFLLTPGEMRQVLTSQGFNILSWVDRTNSGIEWFTQRSKNDPAQPKNALGLDVVMGSEFKTMSENFGRNLSEGKIKLLEIVAERV